MRESRKTLRIARSGPAAPIYRQIKQLVLRKITQGDWRVGAQVPTEQDLVNMLGVSRMTVCRALNELTTEGILTRKSGVGTFVAKTPTPRSLIELRDIGETIVERGQRHTRKVLTCPIFCTRRSERLLHEWRLVEWGWFCSDGDGRRWSVPEC